MQELLNEMMPYIIGILTVLLAFLGNKLGQWINVKVALDKQKQIDNIVKASVQWVESIYGINLVDESQAKFLEAKERALFLLKNAGLEVSEDHLDTLIEAFVYELINKDKKLEEVGE